MTRVRYRFGANYTNQTGDGFYKNLNGVDEGGGVAQGGNGTSYHIEGQLEGNVGSAFDWWAKLATSDYDVSYHTETLLGPLDTREFPVPLFPNANFGTCALPGGAGGLGCAGSPDTIVPGSVLTGKNTIAGNPSSLGTGTFDSGFQSQSKQQNNWIFATHLTFHADGIDIKYLGGYQKFNYDLTAPWTNNQGVSSGVLGYTLQGPAARRLRLFFGSANLAGCTGNLQINSAHNYFTFDEFEKFFSNELNFASTGQGPLQWIGGLYQFHENYEATHQCDERGPAAACDAPQILAALSDWRNSVGAGGPQIRRARRTTNSPRSPRTPTASSVRLIGRRPANSNSPPACATPMTKRAAIRSLSDHGIQLRDARAGLGVNTFGANTPAWDITALPRPATARVTAVPALALSMPTGVAQTSLDAHWDAVTGVAGVSWTPATDILAYAKYSRGYKAGGFNSGINARRP